MTARYEVRASWGRWWVQPPWREGEPIREKYRLIGTADRNTGFQDKKDAQARADELNEEAR